MKKFVGIMLTAMLAVGVLGVLGTVGPASAQQTMHVASIDMFLAAQGANTKAQAEVTVHNANGVGVADATVYGHWEGTTSDSDSGVTDANGIVERWTLQSDSVKNWSWTTFTFVVDNIVKEGWTYDPEANVETSDSIGGEPALGPIRAGLRSSRYGIEEAGFSSFPDSTWWVNSAEDMASRFTEATPGYIWIVGDIDEGVTEDCMLNFPSPDGTYEHVQFSDTDQNEAYLDAFDAAGHEAWLQVESGDADMNTLIDLVLNQYGQHPSVIGFGVDAEWYKSSQEAYGVPVTDAEAENWEAMVKSHNSSYRLFLKHFRESNLPPNYRGDIVFVDDSQGFNGLNNVIEEFANWGAHFDPAPVEFQFGYKRDKKWWNKLSDPPGDIGNAILSNVPNTSGLYWVDFTANLFWPE